MLRIAASALVLALAVSACSPAPAAAPDTTAETPAPQAIESKFATSADGTKIHYAVSGEGPLVVAIHGFPDFSGSWDELRPALDDAYRLAAIDTRGYNLSDQPEGVANYDAAKLVEDVAAVIAAEGQQKAVIVGHDWGAFISWRVALSRSDLVDKLIIMSVPHPANMGRQLQAAPENSNYARNFQMEGSENNLTAEGLARWVQDPAQKAKYVEAFGRSSFAGMMNYYRANYPSGDAPAAPETFPKIDVPVLVIHGMQDQALLSMGHNDTWEHVSKDTSILMVPDAGHFVQHDAAPLVNRTIRDWLDARS